MTQDLDVLKPKFEVIPGPSEYSELPCVKAHVIEDLELKTITEGDALIKYYKYDRKNNWKPYLYESLGVFEV